MPQLRAFVFPRVRLLPWRHDHHVHSHHLHRVGRVCPVFSPSSGAALAGKLHLRILGRSGHFSRCPVDASRLQLMVVARFLDRSLAAGRAEVASQLRAKLGSNLGDRLTLPKLLPIWSGTEGAAVHAINI